MKEITSNIKEFVKGGNATFTIKNDKTNVRYTFKVKKANKDDIFFVSSLYGSNNECDYNYMGIITKQGVYKLTKKSHVKPDSTVNRAFAWFWNKIKFNNPSFPESFHFYHEGRCAKCGRKLTTPESIERGFGPVCWNS